MLDTTKITKQDIIDSLREIDLQKSEGRWNAHLDAVTHFIKFEGNLYPIKYPLNRAYEKQYGKSIYAANNNNFNTYMAKPILEKLGFEIVVNKDAKPLEGHAVNLILYGPPGTGKTFSTKRTSVDIIEGD